MATFNIFFEETFDAVVAHRLHDLKATIESENPQYLMNVNEQEYVSFLESRFRLDSLSLYFDNVHASSHEASVPAERFPQGFYVHAGKTYTRQAIKYHLPFAGDAQLLRCIPNPRVMNTVQVFVEDGAVCFSVVNFWDADPSQVKGRADSILALIRQNYEHLRRQVEQYNASLPATVGGYLTARKEAIKRQGEFMAALGVPIKKASNVPKTFAVPAVRKDLVLRKPPGAEPHKIEPTLDESIYAEILRVIQDTGRVFERLPSTYADKDEETLRDHLLMVLEPHFQMASATGETFNKSGKTDILVRYEKKNVFVAECKFWAGQKKHHETIDQILSYLTWRDSKTAIVYFVPTKDMSAPLKAIDESTRAHGCFVADLGRKEESWFGFDFHLPGDPGRLIKLNVLCFHLPKV
ncbi:MAG: hypothetical protein LAP38_28170 [Acidobacteriia bacterium]|nr:hypothetical protein [Terriglobia bacterium]